MKIREANVRGNYTKMRSSGLPVGSPSTKYLSLFGAKSLILLATYFAAHSPTFISFSKMMRRIFPVNT